MLPFEISKTKEKIISQSIANNLNWLRYDMKEKLLISQLAPLFHRKFSFPFSLFTISNRIMARFYAEKDFFLFSPFLQSCSLCAICRWWDFLLFMCSLLFNNRRAISIIFRGISFCSPEKRRKKCSSLMEINQEILLWWQWH